MAAKRGTVVLQVYEDREAVVNGVVGLTDGLKLRDLL